MLRKITYTDKEDILGLTAVDNKNKVTAQDMNDIKNAINDNTLSFNVIIPVFVVEEKVFENEEFVHPEWESLHATEIFLLLFVHVVESPLTIPQVGAVLST